MITILFRVVLASSMLFAPVVLSACSSPTLPVGLTARMDQPGASLDRVEAVNLINQFRRSRGVAPLSADASLDNMANQLAARYAQTGTRPEKPENVLHIRVSAGYANFAETFSGWRGQTADANTIADPAATRVGLAVTYSSSSEYGTHWVLLLGTNVPAPVPSATPAQ